MGDYATSRFLLPDVGSQPEDAFGRSAEWSLQDAENRIIVGDCLPILRRLPAKCVDLVHTSPPYNIDRPYKGRKGDLHPESDYLGFLDEVIYELKRVIRPGGSIFWQTGYTQRQNGIPGDIAPIDVLTYDSFHNPPNEMILWDRIIWRYFGGMAFKKKFTNRHETILWYVRPAADGVAEPTFDVDEVRETTRELDKRNNFWGRNPGNVWEVDRVAFGTTDQTSHIAVYPEEITERIIRSCSRVGDLVLDPFSGSGTTPKVARSLGRRWMGIEISEEYAAEAALRIGFTQCAEAQSLASALIKEEVFKRKRASTTITEITSRLDAILNPTTLARIRREFDAVVTAAFNDRSRGKADKISAWQVLSDWIESEPAKDVVVWADRLLMDEYKLRRNWNGAQRYRTALRALEDLAMLFHGDANRASLVEGVVANEPSSYRVTKALVELVQPNRLLRERPDATYAPGDNGAEEDLPQSSSERGQPPLPF